MSFSVAGAIERGLERLAASVERLAEAIESLAPPSAPSRRYDNRPLSDPPKDGGR